MATPPGTNGGTPLPDATSDRDLDGAVRRRGWRIDALALAAVAVVLRLPALFATRSLVFDDGVFASSALAMRAGEAPFRDVFSSQGPLFLPLVWLADLLGLRTLDAPRLVAVAAGVLATVATYSCARRLTTRANARFAAGLLTTSGSILWVTGPVNADGPALSLSVLAVALALRYRDDPRLMVALGVGLAAGAAVSIKALSVPAVLVAGLVVLLSHRRVLDATAAGVTGLVVYLVSAAPWGVERVWDQSFRYHDEARRLETPAGAIGKILGTLWDRDIAVLAALLLAGAMLLLAHHDAWRVSLPAARPVARVTVAGLVLWALLVVALLAWEPALFRPHVAHLIPPLVLLAALRPPPWRVLLVAAIVVVPLWAVQNRAILWPEGYSGDTAALVHRLRSLPDEALVISDEPGLAWRAGHRPPGALADPSFQRIDSGDITVGSLVDAASATDVCAVVVTSADHFGRFGDLGDRLATLEYLPERFGPRITLYARPGCDGP
jgi:4-amino-4-deoxy-L-arabinose transferase-like glycosyltransferase